MQPAERFPKQLLQQMHKVFFDLSPEGVLTYQDPMIGPLANPQKQLAVLANLKQARLELKVCGLIEQVFELNQGISQACGDAFNAYFAAFESLCRGEARATKAA